jgi:hypothetical protein
MFERYTEKARRVIFFARYEASHYGWPQIEPEHLLLGLVHEERLLCGQWLPNAQPDWIRQRIDRSVERRPVTPTSVDLPLSPTAKAVLFHAKDEADRVNSKHIRTEHLLLGLIQEDSLAASILFEDGADPDKLRASFEQRSAGQLAPRGPQPRVGAESVQIHGLWWNSVYIRDGVKRCRRRNWHWQKASWKPRDVVVHRGTGKISLDLSLLADPDNFQLLSGGWQKDHCAVCAWELYETEDHHGTGYTNGTQWLCEECFEKFWQRPDFIAGKFSDLT